MAKTLFALKKEGSSTNAVEILDTNGAVTVKLDGTQILGERGALVADATDAATAITSLNAVIARLEAHGLIAPN